MTTDEPAHTHQNQRARPREIEAAIRDLNVCVQRIHALIPRVNAMIDRRTAQPRPKPGARVVYGGGPSAFVPRHQPAQPVTSSQPRAVRPLIVAADLALAGYSKEQIRERVRQFDDPRAVEALNEAFE